MLQALKYWPYALAALVGIVIGYTVGYYAGTSNGRELEQSKQVVTVAKETIKSQSQREKFDNETRSLSDPDVDAGLASGGWLRSD